MCTKGIHGWVSDDTLDQPSIDTQSTLHQHLSWHTWWTMVESQLIFNQFTCIGRHSADYRLTVDQVLIVSTENQVMSMEHWSIKGIDWEYWSTLDQGCLYTHDPIKLCGVLLAFSHTLLILYIYYHFRCVCTPNKIATETLKRSFVFLFSSQVIPFQSYLLLYVEE